MTKAEYQEYLKSEHWQLTRERMLREAEYRCEKCDADGVLLDVHHNSYDNLGDEQLGDLVVLCRECHETIHGKMTWARRWAIAYAPMCNPHAEQAARDVQAAHMCILECILSDAECWEQFLIFGTPDTERVTDEVDRHILEQMVALWVDLHGDGKIGPIASQVFDYATEQSSCIERVAELEAQGAARGCQGGRLRRALEGLDLALWKAEQCAF